MTRTLHTQRGAILVTSLLILLVLTIIGVTAMQMTRMQERMVGNQRDLSLGFQGAEAALRQAELQIRGYVSAPLKCGVVDACATVFDREILPQLADQDQAWWTDVGTAYDADLQNLELAAEPEFVVEELMDVRDCLEVTECGRRTIYQVTARSTGASGLTEVVLQSTFAKPPY